VKNRLRERRGRQLVRILLAGGEHFTDGMLEDLERDAVEVVGRAQDVDEAILEAERLWPDVVLLDPSLAAGAHRLAARRTVVVAPPLTGNGPLRHTDNDLDLLRTALALASALPSKPEIT
jgi:DNA-binding NarL/FixJ family response regulator